MTAPECPYRLGKAGRAWWEWVWTTPQAERWNAGALYTAARRAALEDDRAAKILADGRSLVVDLLEGAEPDAIARVTEALELLAASAAKTTVLSREMRELETQLGLGPKAAAALGMKAEDAPPKTSSGLDDLAQRRSARRQGAAGA